jgi:hypothetical protein
MSAFGGAVIVVVIAACSGGGGGSVPPIATVTSTSGGVTTTTAHQTETIDCVRGTGYPAGGLPDYDTIVLGVVALPTKRALQTARLDPSPTALLFGKDGLVFRSGVAFDLDVAPESRGNLSMAWEQGNGDQPVEHLRVPACIPVYAQSSVGAQTSWLDFVGGYYVKHVACVAIIVTVGQTHELVHIGVGAPCPGQQPPEQPSDT